MKLFGLNISISRRSAPESTPVSQLSPQALAWLRGDDVSTLAQPSLSSAYEQVVWVYRAVNAIAEQIASIPFVFSRGERGRESLITSGPLIDFYSHPHPHINAYQYWELRLLWLLIRGEAIRIPVFNDSVRTPSPIKNQKSRIRSILLLDPNRFTHVIRDNELIGWRYTGSQSDPAESQIFLPEEVWFDRLPNPFNFWRGLSPLFVASLAAKTDYAAANFMWGFMENNADAGLIVRSDQQLTDEQKEQIIATIKNRRCHPGALNRSMFLWGVNEVLAPKLSSADIQFLENRKLSRAEICAAFGVPEEIVTSTDHNKYDVMQGARLNFIENRIAPLCARLEAMEDVTVKAIDPTAVGWFDLDALPIMQQARRNRLAAAKTGFDMGIPFNELNRILDLGFKPLPWGDTGYLPAKYNPLLASAPVAQTSESAVSQASSLRPQPPPVAQTSVAVRQDSAVSQASSLHPQPPPPASHPALFTPDPNSPPPITFESAIAVLEHCREVIDKIPDQPPPPSTKSAAP